MGSLTSRDYSPSVPTPLVDRPSRAGGPRARVGALLRHQRIAFLLVGGANLMIFTSAFLALHALLGARLGYLLLVTIAYAFAICCAFLLHRKFVFKVQGLWLTDFVRFSMVQLVSLGLNLLILPLLVEVAGLAVVPAQLITTVLVVVFNYFGHMLFSFRRPVDTNGR